MIINNTFLSVINSPVRTITGKVEMYEGETLIKTFSHTDNLIEFTIERAGEEKFFGFGVCQKINIKLLDIKREIEVTTSNSFKLYLNDVNTSPIFYVTEVNRDENTNELSITAYDAIYKATAHTVSELNLTSYTIREFADACASLLGLGDSIHIVFDDVAFANHTFTLSYPEGANFEGTETIRDALNAVADATQTIFYINQNNRLIFKQLDKDGDPIYTIDKSKYFTLDSKTNRRLTKVAHVTELGDNVTAGLDQTGTTHYIRDNAFLELRTDVGTILNLVLVKVLGLTINQFECEWRGNPLLEIGDKIALSTKDDDVAISYVLNDTITYNGSLSQKSQWNFTDSEETESNPSTLGEALNQTFARVDKVNKQITLLASDVTENSNKISRIQMDVDNITLDVSTVVKEEMSNINVGGENLILNSNWEKGLDVNWSSSRCFEIDASDSSLKYVITSSSIAEERYKHSDAISLDGLHGRDLAFSCEYWVQALSTRPIAMIAFFDLEEEVGTEECISYVFVIPSTSDMKTHEWNRVCHVVTVPDNANFVRVSACSPSNEAIWWRRLQLQLGSVATDWHPSPYDIGQDVNDLKGQVQANTESIASLQINADNISATVKEIQTNTEEALETVGSDIATLTKQVQASMTSEDVSILIQQEMADGVNSVTTETGYKFDKDGLTIKKSGHEMSTKVDEDGMTIYKNESEVMLDVDNQGVTAKNINVSTYLIVGSNSRFENYGSDRTGCFFIGNSN